MELSKDEKGRIAESNPEKTVEKNQNGGVILFFTRDPALYYFISDRLFIKFYN